MVQQHTIVEGGGGGAFVTMMMGDTMSNQICSDFIHDIYTDLHRHTIDYKYTSQ